MWPLSSSIALATRGGLTLIQQAQHLCVALIPVARKVWQPFVLLRLPQKRPFLRRAARPPSPLPFQPLRRATEPEEAELRTRRRDAFASVLSRGRSAAPGNFQCKHDILFTEHFGGGSLMQRLGLSAALAAAVVAMSGCADGGPAATRSSVPPTTGSVLGAAGQDYCLDPWYAGGTAYASIVNPYERNPTTGDRNN